MRYWPMRSCAAFALLSIFLLGSPPVSARLGDAGPHFALSAGAAYLSPSGEFYKGFRSAPAVQFGLMLLTTETSGRVSGLSYGITAQLDRLRCDREFCDYVYDPYGSGSGAQCSRTEGNVTAGQYFLEIARNFPIALDRSRAFILLGLGVLHHSGRLRGTDVSDDELAYHPGSELAIRLGAGMAPQISSQLALGFAFRCDVLRFRYVYVDTGAMSEPKSYGILLSFGANLERLF
jgi:hypothetical protein